MLDDLYPLLRTVQPAELNATLERARHRARGPRRAARREPRDRRRLPQAAQPADARRSARTSPGWPTCRHIYADARRPSCCGSLRNTPSTTSTVEDQQDAAARASSPTTPASPTTTRSFLDENGDRLIRLGQVSRPSWSCWRAYSPGVPLPARRAWPQSNDVIGEAFRDVALHIVLEIAAGPAARLHRRATSPVYGEHRGPELLRPAAARRRPWPAQPRSGTARPRTGDGADQRVAAAASPTRRAGSPADRRGAAASSTPSSAPRSGVPADRGARPRVAAVRARWPAGRR